MNKTSERESILAERFAKYTAQLNEIKVEYNIDIANLADVVTKVDSTNSHLLIVEDAIDKIVFDSLFLLTENMNITALPFFIIDKENFEKEFKILEDLSERFEFKINLIVNSDEMGKLIKSLVDSNEHFTIYTYDQFKSKESLRPKSGIYTVFDFISPILSQLYPNLWEDFVIMRDEIDKKDENINPLFPKIFEFIKFLLITSFKNEIKAKSATIADSDSYKEVMTNLLKVSLRESKKYERKAS